MCNNSCISFAARALRKEEVQNKKVLEVGSLDVNGSVQSMIKALGPSLYIGVDVTHGRGVDEICSVDNLVQRFGVESFDVLVSTEMLEHVQDWKLAINQIKSVLKPDGILVITTRSPGYPRHNHPIDFWRFTREHVEAMMRDFILDCVEDDPEMIGIFWRATKPKNWTPIDLTGMEVALAPSV